MSSMTYSKIIDDLTRVLLAADMSCMPQFRGAGRSNPDILQVAERRMHSDKVSDKWAVRDAQTQAQAAWYDYLKPKLLEMLETVCADRKHAEAVLDKHFSDEGIQWQPRR